MTMRERFTDEEWLLVTHIPFDAFYFGAMADGKVEDGELKEFVETIEKAPMLKDPLHREIALEYATGGGARLIEEVKFETSENASAMHARIERTKRILQEKLTREEYQGFFKSVWINAMAVAGGSPEKKKHFWDKKSGPINEKEAAALAAFALAWEIDLSFLKAHVA